MTGAVQVGFSTNGKEQVCEGRAERPATIDEYIASYPPEVQAILQRVRATIGMIARIVKVRLRENRQRLDARNKKTKRA